MLHSVHPGPKTIRFLAGLHVDVSGLPQPELLPDRKDFGGMKKNKLVKILIVIIQFRLDQFSRGPTDERWASTSCRTFQTSTSFKSPSGSKNVTMGAYQARQMKKIKQGKSGLASFGTLYVNEQRRQQQSNETKFNLHNRFVFVIINFTVGHWFFHSVSCAFPPWRSYPIVGLKTNFRADLCIPAIVKEPRLPNRLMKSMTFNFQSQ